MSRTSLARAMSALRAFQICRALVVGLIAGVLGALAPAAAQEARDEQIIALHKTLEGRWEGTSVSFDFITLEFVTDENYGFTFGLINEEGTDRAFWGGEFNVLGVYEGEGKMFESVWVDGALFQERIITLSEFVGPDAAGNLSFSVHYETLDPEGVVWEGNDLLALQDGVFRIVQQMRPDGTEDPYFQTAFFELTRAE